MFYAYVLGFMLQAVVDVFDDILCSGGQSKFPLGAYNKDFHVFYCCI